METSNIITSDITKTNRLTDEEIEEYKKKCRPNDTFMILDYKWLPKIIQSVDLKTFKRNYYKQRRHPVQYEWRLTARPMSINKLYTY